MKKLMLVEPRPSEWVDWEDKVTQAIEERWELCRSDAQALVEGQPATLATCWARGLDASVSAEQVMRAASPPASSTIC